MRLNAEKSCVVIVDVQEKLIPLQHNIESCLHKIKLLIKIATFLKIPLIYTSHYTKGLGPIAESLMTYPHQLFEKMTFSCCGHEDFLSYFKKLNRTQVLVAGLETHVCVLQTLMDFKHLGYNPYLVADASTARSKTDKTITLQRLALLQIPPVTVEMAIYEWLEQAGTQEFKHVNTLLKEQQSV
jgi:nicotinamidase-related amidase